MQSKQQRYLTAGVIAVLAVMLQACGGSSSSGGAQTSSAANISNTPWLQPVACNQASLPSYAADPQRPVIRLNGLAVIQHPLNAPYEDAGVSANDPVDGNIASQVVIKGLDKLDVNKAGDYLLRYNLTDSRGLVAAEVVRMVRVNAGDLAPLSARPLGSTNAGEGYYERLPASYGASDEKFPLIIYLHGSGEVGTDLTVLSGGQGNSGRNITALINPDQGAGTQHFVVLFPQRCANIVVASEVEAFIDYAIHSYQVDPARVYLVGLSAGGGQVWHYLENYPNTVAAAAVLAGVNVVHNACLFENVPLWLFHSADDPTVPVAHSKEIVSALNNCPSPPAERPRLTIFPTGGHVIDATVLPLTALGTGLNTYDVYSPDIYTWFLQHHR